MAALTGLYISQSYGGVIHLSTNAGISGTTPTQLQDGIGNNMGVWFNGAGNVSASSFTGLASSATSASYSNNGFPFAGSAKISGSLGVTGSVSITNGLEVKAGDLDFVNGNLNVYSGNINQTLGSIIQADTTANNSIAGKSTMNSLTLSQGATGSLLGTASFANNAASSSYANNSTSASYALNSTTASYALNSTTASYATTSTSASYAVNATLYNGTASAVFATTSSNSFNGNQIITGSLIVTGSQNLRGVLSITGSSFNQPAVVSIASNTASLDFNSSNMFTLTLPNSAINTHISASNLRPGASAALQITQGLAATATVTFSSAFTFPSGSSYTAYASASANDVISLLSFDGSTLRAVGANNFI